LSHESTAAATPAAFNSDAPAPGLFVDPGRWSALREKLEDPFFATILDRSTDRLDEMIERIKTEPITFHRVWKGLVQHGAVAWHLTGETKYRDLAMDTLLHACDRDWGPSQRHKTGGIRKADLGTGELMYTVAFGLDALFDDLSVDQRKTLVHALIENGIGRYFAGIEAEDWWVRCDFNWNSALHGNAGIAALAIRDHDPALSERTLAAAKHGLRFMVDAYHEGGGWTEGLMYFGTATGHLSDFAFCLHRVTGDDFGALSNQNIHDSIDFALIMHGRDGKPFNFSNINEPLPEEPAEKARLGWVRPFVFWYADHLDRPDWAADQQRKIEAGALRHIGGLFTDIDSFWFRRAHQPAEPREIRGLHHFHGIDWLTWHGEKSWLAFRSGFNGGNHNNRDLGQIIFGLDETRYLIDPGYGSGEAAMHNCITVRHKDQADGATARIIDLEERADGFRLICDIREAFPWVLSHYDRHLAVVDDQHLIIVEHVVGRGAIRNDMEGHLQTRLPARITDEGFAIDGEAGTLRVVFGSDVGRKSVETWYHKKGNDPIQCLSWRDAYYRIHSIQPIVLTTSDAAIKQRITDDGVEFAVGGRRLHLPLRALTAEG